MKSNFNMMMMTMRN